MKKIIQLILLLLILMGHTLNANAEISVSTKAKLDNNIMSLNKKLDNAVNGDIKKADNYSEILLKKIDKVKNEEMHYLLERVITHLQEFHGIKNEKDTGSKYYEKTASGVYFWDYNYEDDIYFYRQNLMKGADIESFQGLQGKYAKDKNNVYSRGERNVLHRNTSGEDEWADVKSFTVIDEYYAKDKKVIYGLVFGRTADMTGWDGDGVGTVGIADVNTFQALGQGYGKDKNKVFLGAFEIEGADPKTFEIINKDYSKDKNNVYSGYTFFEPKIDPKTFEIINKDYSKDKNNVYKNGVVQKKIDPKTFVPTNY